jgi:HAMP domain-containing protein
MQAKSGKEMRKLLVAVSVTTLVLVLAVIAYFMIDVIVTTNSNIERNKELVIEQSVSNLTEIGNEINGMIGSPEIINMFNQELINDILSGNWEVFYGFIGDAAINLYPIQYVGVIRGGELVYSETKTDYGVDEDKMSTQPPEMDFETLDALGDEEGFFVSVFWPIDLSVMGLEDFYVNMIVDRTDDMASVTAYFEDQRNDLILRLSIVSIIAIILSLLITTIGLRYFTRKYVVEPIEELNRTAEEISGGTFKGEVEVDPDSAYAALQGLLRSGQKVLSRMDDEMRD